MKTPFIKWRCAPQMPPTPAGRFAFVLFALTVALLVAWMFVAWNPEAGETRVGILLLAAGPYALLVYTGMAVAALLATVYCLILAVSRPGRSFKSVGDSVAVPLGVLGVALIGSFTALLVASNQSRLQQAATTMSMSVDGHTVIWTGKIRNGDTGRLQELIGARSDVTLVMHNHSGGVVNSAHYLAERLDQLGITSVVASGKCESACTMVWAASSNRALAPGARLGFHAPHSLVSKEVSDRKAAQRMYAWYRAAGFTETFIDQVRRIPPSATLLEVTADNMPKGISFTMAPEIDHQTTGRPGP